jgi:hypothetical protein
LNFTLPRILTLSAALGSVGVALAGAGCSSTASDSAPLVTSRIDGSSGGGSSGGPSGDAAPAPWDGGLASSCAPADVSTYKPAWRKSAKFYQGVCAAGDLDNFRAACLGSDASACAKAVSADCAKCIATDEAADVYGAVILHKGWVELNVPGCVANAMMDPTGVRCAAAMQAVDMCDLAACGANCPVTSDATLSLLGACRDAADVGQCATLAGEAQCQQGLADAGAAVAACISGTSFAEAFTTIAGLFCLPSQTPPPGDAGAGGG